MLNTKSLEPYTKDCIDQKHRSLAPLNLLSIDLKKPSVIHIVCQKQREQHTFSRVDGVNVKPFQLIGWPPPELCQNSEGDKRVSRFTSWIEASIKIWDIGIVYHYSNWWCNPKGSCLHTFERKKKTNYEKRTKIATRVRLIILFLSTTLKISFS